MVGPGGPSFLFLGVISNDVVYCCSLNFFFAYVEPDRDRPYALLAYEDSFFYLSAVISGRIQEKRGIFMKKSAYFAQISKPL